MLSNYYTLRCVAASLDDLLRGKTIGEVYSQHADELTLAFQGEPRRLVLSCRTDAPVAYLHDAMVRAKRNTVDLLGGCVGHRVEAVRVEIADRILTLVLDGGMRLCAVLFGPHPHVLLLDARGNVQDAFKTAKKLRPSALTFGTSRQVRPTLDALREAASGARPASLLSLIKKTFPSLGGTLAQEILTRAGIPFVHPPSEITEGLLSQIEDALEGLLRDLQMPAPRVYVKPDGTPTLLSLIPLRQAAGLSERTFESIHDAIRFFLGRRSAARELSSERVSVLTTLQRAIEKAHRALRAMTADEEAGMRAEEYERFGSFLMTHLSALSKGMHGCQAEIDGQIVSIPLEASLSPVQNAQRYHEKAKHARAAHMEAAKRQRELNERIRRGERLLEEAEHTMSKEELNRFLEENAAALDEFGLGTKSKQHEELPFRIFTVEGGFEVWAGKSSANNDLLTLRYAKPDDLWFHARGASGSHVVLKVASGKGEPGKKAREQAAGIAAYYSKMKNARLVPVAMTLKRYVRKPRGASPGTVVIEREKVLFAEPALPSQVRD